MSDARLSPGALRWIAKRERYRKQTRALRKKATAPPPSGFHVGQTVRYGLSTYKVAKVGRTRLHLASGAPGVLYPVPAAQCAPLS